MALHIVKKCDKDRLMELNTFDVDINDDEEDGDIETRISRQRAEELLYMWKKILLEHERSGNNLENLHASMARQETGEESLLHGDTPVLE